MALTSVSKLIEAVVIPERVLLTFEVSPTRSSMTAVVPVFPAVSVAMILTVLTPPGSPVSTRDQLPDPRVAIRPFTVTLAMPPESLTVPVNVGEPAIIALLMCDHIFTMGAVVSSPGTTLIVRVMTRDVFPALSVYQYWRGYTPRVAVFMLPELAILMVPVPSRVSLQIAPDSLYIAHCIRVRPPEPMSVTSGRVTSKYPVSVIHEATTGLEVFPE